MKLPVVDAQMVLTLLSKGNNNHTIDAIKNELHNLVRDNVHLPDHVVCDVDGNSKNHSFSLDDMLAKKVHIADRFEL